MKFIFPKECLHHTTEKYIFKMKWMESASNWNNCDILEGFTTLQYWCHPLLYVLETTFPKSQSCSVNWHGPQYFKSCQLAIIAVNAMQTIWYCWFGSKNSNRSCWYKITMILLKVPWFKKMTMFWFLVLNDACLFMAEIVFRKPRIKWDEISVAEKKAN